MTSLCVFRFVCIDDERDGEMEMGRDGRWEMGRDVVKDEGPADSTVISLSERPRYHRYQELEMLF